MMFLEISIPVVVSAPSKPGVEFTSRIKGPRLDCKISTPHTPSFNAFAAAVASCDSSLLHPCHLVF